MPVIGKEKLRLLKLKSPIFIEDSFSAPFYNEETKQKIKGAIEWVESKKEINQFIYLDRYMYPQDTNFKLPLIDFFNETVKINDSLLKRNENIETNLLKATTNLFVKNPIETLTFVNFYRKLFSMSRCFNPALNRILTELPEQDKITCDFLHHHFYQWRMCLDHYLLNL